MRDTEATGPAAPQTGPAAGESQQREQQQQLWNHAEPPPRAGLSLSVAEDEANSASSHDEGSSADETTPAVASSEQNGSGATKKRKRTKYQKTSYVDHCRSVALIATPLPCLIVHCHVFIAGVCESSWQHQLHKPSLSLTNLT